VLLFLYFSFSAAVWAQSTAQISGTVKDQSGAVLPGVEVTVTQTDTGVKRTALTNETGSYVFPNLLIGPYRLEAALAGFRTFVQNGIVLQVDANPVINAVLEVGQVSEQVQVEANAALVETRSSGVGTVVDNQRVLEMPLNGRNVQELVLLSGMANVYPASTNINSSRNYLTVVISVAGGIANGVLYQLDGVNHNDMETNLNLPMPFPDALQEFKVETSALPAQYGLHSSGAVNAVTKSGTNEFHGDAFEFVRNGVFNARDFFAPRRDTLKRNQFGGVIGGPIKQNNLFFFAGYQGTTQRSDPANNISYVPTPAMLTGDFTTIASPSCAGKQITLPASLGFVNNRISTSLLNQAALNISSHLPLSADPCGKVNFGILSNQNEHLGVTRLDYTKSEKHSIYGRLFIANQSTPSTYDGRNLLTVQSFAQTNRVTTLALGDTYLVSSALVSTSRVSATRTKIEQVPDNVGTWPSFGVNANSFLIPVISLSVSATSAGSGFAIGGGNSIYSIADTGPNYSAYQDFSLLRGTHQYAFGGSYMHTENAYHSGVNANGSASFNGQFTGIPLGDFLMGIQQTWKQGNLSTYYNRQQYFGVYAQDTWKLTPRLTVNYGLRWEPYFPFSSKYGWFSRFDQSLFNQNVHSSLYANAPAGIVFPGDPQYACGQKVECSRWAEFLPRVGLAWDPKGDGRTSIRAAYGYFLDRPHVTSLTGYGQDVPYGNTISLTDVNLSNPWATYPGGNPLPIQLQKNMVFPTFGTYVSHPASVKPIGMNQWNLSIQRQLGDNWLVTANYVGNGILHLPTGYEFNPAVFMGLGPCTINGVNYSTCSTTANTNQRRVLFLQNPSQGQYYGTISSLDDGGTGNYSGLYLSLQKRISHGVSVLANYTWSHCISDYWNNTVGGSGADKGWNPGGRSLERSNCIGTDQRQGFNLSTVLQTPAFSGRALRLAASNWQFSPLVKVRTGQYITVTTGVDNALNGTTTQRPNQILANPYMQNKSASGWLNPAAFANPAPGTYGNLGNNNLLGPKYFQLDFALSRTFSLGEKRTLQLRAEVFNLPNFVNFSAPVATLNSTGTFGKILSDVPGNSIVQSGANVGPGSGDPRIMQFALKYSF
jgi:hypothetical protein